MIQPELIALAAKVGQGLATASETKLFLVQFHAKINELRDFVATLPKLALAPR